ncbi:hypothetical protein [Streptomyces erythrochromogenes]|uniref:hypothetical protein n=1 Tax=Streptomyces erythrochromogenes TaxID=285574 RepID=UPI003674D5FD
MGPRVLKIFPADYIPTSLGDLARLAVEDPAWPSAPDWLGTYLEQAGATPAAFQTITDA